MGIPWIITLGNCGDGIAGTDGTFPPRNLNFWRLTERFGFIKLTRRVRWAKRPDGIPTERPAVLGGTIRFGEVLVSVSVHALKQPRHSVAAEYAP